MQVRRLGTTFFAEVTGIDLSELLDDATFAKVREAHLEHGVLVFRAQDLSPQEHMAFSSRFGPLQVHPMGQFNLEGAPQILLSTR
jgi:taurine dioxygenase